MIAGAWRKRETVSTPGIASMASPTSVENGTKLVGETIRSALMTSSMIESIDFVVEAPRTPIVVTSVRPMRIAVAVAAVRRRSRWALRTASRPTVPVRASGAPTTPTTNRLNTGASTITPPSTAAAPSPAVPSRCVSSGSDTAQPSRPTPRTVSTVPRIPRTRSPRAGRETSSRIAATGGTREARRAGK